MIRKTFKSPEDMISDFDFTIVKCALIKEDNLEGEEDFLLAVDGFVADDEYIRLYENKNVICFKEIKTGMNVELMV
jgi:hypothetical protein